MTDQTLEITVSEYVSSWRGNGTQLVDVREREEWDEGHIAGATLIPLSELEARRSELDPRQSIAIVCRSGRRSLLAAEYLRAMGYRRAVSVAGGMLDWVQAGLPVER
ncbi:MAG: rhodanese-like domain-containing protein [Thermomicrobiales bacterium]|nr:rhodanese-like domain-containing protein [Thermomicrobiales bacterium]